MCTLVSLSKELKNNYKVDYIKERNEISLSDSLSFENIVVVAKSRKNLIERAKAIYIKEAKENKFRIKVFVNSNPKENLLKSFYENREITIEWESAKYGHDNPHFEFIGTKEDVNMLINWQYSKNN